MVNLNKKNIGRTHTFNYRILCVVLLFAPAMNFQACKGKGKHKGTKSDTAVASSPIPSAHYDLSKPAGMTLGNKLHEISGIAYISSNTILGENDEQGKIFSILLDKPEDVNYASMRFGDKDDYEDIVVVDSTAYMLVSDGEIVEVPGFAKGGDVAGTNIAQIAGTKNEFESLYYDKAANSLIMLCKSCHHEKNEIRTAYQFDLKSRKFMDTAFFTISIGDVAAKINENDAKFFPSAAAIHPLLNKLYVVSSIGKLLVVTDTKGKVEEVYKLDAATFRQPEGIAFAPNGDMYISNEGGDGQATLLKFAYKP